MYEFYDKNGNMVKFTYENEMWNDKIKHVLVITKYKNSWLFTKHKKRGLEFPGGKVEADETLEEAAMREVYEETGGFVKKLYPIGQYEVSGKDEDFYKKVYFAEIEKIKKKGTYLETGGPVLIDIEKTTNFSGKEFSFIMQDQVVPLCIQRIREKFLSK
ncbi:RNA deprotection pyrophosphohydrolase [Pallidibacillus pasinlerensis]|uniref:Nucleoside triphosphatase YtkD n=1 Tax=Pallidibacillus pasinlerensis TaxID=2703818 RepID=A0ABX0A5K7_9BACI|nr:nucleoside triphosphatase YtkD [Pallidibacillus pasinlerensis]NCU17796.1 nucleoside triphosphatase YtkD [Pallidibacillus pasinlerensis]